MTPQHQERLSELLDDFALQIGCMNQHGRIMLELRSDDEAYPFSKMAYEQSLDEVLRARRQITRWVSMVYDPKFMES